MDHLNAYTTEFFAPCPVNGIRISYRLRIESDQAIPVEQILAEVDGITGMHEGIADHLKNTLGGDQTLSAYHHGVQIETRR